MLGSPSQGRREIYQWKYFLHFKHFWILLGLSNSGCGQTILAIALKTDGEPQLRSFCCCTAVVKLAGTQSDASELNPCNFNPRRKQG